jgi:hypothetical protein
MSKIQTAYRLAALAARQRFVEQRAQDAALLKQIRIDDVAVFTGSYDHVEKVLGCLEGPCWKSKRKRF